MRPQNRKLYTVITGASEGLGKSLAIECADRKLNMVLVALPASGLEKLASFISVHYLVEVICVELDLSSETSCQQLFNLIKDKNIGVNMLINNAGLGGTTWFEEGDLCYFRKQIQVNILSTVQLTHLLLPVLCRQPSYILNVSSLCTFFFLPKKQVYGASKSFIYYFSKSLRRELKKDGITISVLCPGGINSNPNQYLLNQSLYGIAKLSVMNPGCVAKIAINSLLKGNEVIIPGWYNKLFLALNYIIPQRLKDSISEANIKKIRPTALASLLRFDI